MESSPVYELRKYTINPKDANTALELVNKHHAIRTKHSKLFGFWMTEVGSGITQVIHIWEYESLSHRRQIVADLAGDDDWNHELFFPLLPCILQWENALLVQSPGFKLHLDFQNDPSAVYLFEEAKVSSYKKLPCLKEHTKDGHGQLVARFCGLLGPSNTEYRLWRFLDIDHVTEASKKRASDEHFEGRTTMLIPAPFSPLR